MKKQSNLPGGADSAGQNSAAVDLGLVTNLIHYHRIRNAAEGVGADTRFVAGLIDYGVWLQSEEAKRLTQAAFYRGIIDNARQRVTVLLESADTADKRREILPEVIKLNDTARNAGEALKELTNG